MKNFFLIISILCLSYGAGQAQNHVLNDILQAKTNGTGAIINDGIVTGYYAFYEFGKNGSNTSTYRLDIFDQNLGPLSKKTFSGTEGMIVREATFNGEILAIKFEEYSPKGKKYSYKLFDRNAEMFKTTKKDAYSLDYKVGQAGEDGENMTLFPIPKIGFINYSTANKKGQSSQTRYIIDFIPQKEEQQSWTVSTKTTSEEYESATFLGTDGKILLSLNSKKSGSLSKDINETVIGIDLATGKRLFENDIEDKKYAVAILDAVNDEETGNFVLMGNYFEKDAKTAKAKSLGICAFTMDSTGKVLARKYVSWDKDIDKLMPKGKNGKSVDIKNLFFHKFVKTADGRFFGIGEQYHASASGIGIVASFVSHSTLSYVKIVVEDLYIFEFDSDFSLKSLKIFDKPSRNVQMPAITLFDSPRVLAMLMKVHGEFDYKFTQQSKDKSLFNVGYIDFEKTKEDKSSVFNSINYSDGKFTTDKLKLNSKATWYTVYPGKPGYVMISEYFEKAKKMEFRIEKVNF